MPTPATLVVMARNCTSLKHAILRRQTVTTFEEVASIRAAFPRNDIGVSLHPEGAEDLWTWFPEMDDPNWDDYRFGGPPKFKPPTSK